MCGRFSVNSEQVEPWLLDTLDIKFSTYTNNDIRPTNHVATIIKDDDRLQQLNASWGIKPSWSKKLIINAQGETAATKRTFKDSFNLRRCIVPCTSWFEWRVESDNKKQKYAFTHSKNVPFLMAGIWFKTEDLSQLVTFTTHPNKQCGQYHRRMPVIINPEDVDYWFNASAEQVRPLIEPISGDFVSIAQS